MTDVTLKTQFALWMDREFFQGMNLLRKLFSEEFAVSALVSNFLMDNVGMAEVVVAVVAVVEALEEAVEETGQFLQFRNSERF